MKWAHTLTGGRCIANILCFVITILVGCSKTGGDIQEKSSSGQKVTEQKSQARVEKKPTEITCEGVFHAAMQVGEPGPDGHQEITMRKLLACGQQGYDLQFLKNCIYVNMKTQELDGVVSGVLKTDGRYRVRGELAGNQLRVSYCEYLPRTQ